MNIEITLPKPNAHKLNQELDAYRQILVALKELVERIHFVDCDAESVLSLQGSCFVEQAIVALRDAGATVTTKPA